MTFFTNQTAASRMVLARASGVFGSVASRCVMACIASSRVATPEWLPADLDGRAHPAVAIPLGRAGRPITGTRWGCRRREKATDSSADSSADDGTGIKAVVVVMMVMMVMMMVILDAQ
jgi:hypothetical protein